MSNDSALDRFFDRSELLIEPWLTRGPGSGAIFRCIDCSVADPNSPAVGSCHARLFKLSGYRPPCELSESFFWQARAALDILYSAPPRADDPDDVRAKASYARAEASRLWLELLCIVDAPRDETGTERGKRIARLNDLSVLAGLLNAAKSDPDECARATRLWFELYRVVWRQRDETGNERAERIGRIDKLAAVAGLSPILFYLQEFERELSHAAFISTDPVKKLDRILHGTPRRGPKERSFQERIEISAAVEKLRGEGMTRENAEKEVAETTRPCIGKEAVRHVYEGATRKNAGKSLVRLIAAGVVEL
jgi:hypothetical protein